jgi:hypothetical protein
MVYLTTLSDRLCGLLVRVPSYRSRGPVFNSRRYQISWVVGLERSPLSLVSTIEGLLGRKSSDSGLEDREYGRTDPSRWPRSTLYPQKLTLTSPTSGCSTVGIVYSWSQATEFYLTTLSVARNMQRRKTWRLKAIRWQGHRTKRSWPIPRHYPASFWRDRKTTRTIIPNSLCLF